MPRTSKEIFPAWLSSELVARSTVVFQRGDVQGNDCSLHASEEPSALGASSIKLSTFHGVQEAAQHGGGISSGLVVLHGGHPGVRCHQTASMLGAFDELGRDQEVPVVQSLSALLSDPTISSYRENVLEQLFCSELLQAAWRAGLPAVEIDRPFVDFQGYDLVATCGRVTRHLQLKGRIATGRGIRGIDVQRALADKPSACVIQMLAEVTGEPERLLLRYRFFGSSPGQRLELEGLATARRRALTRTPAGLHRPERPALVTIPMGRFKRPCDIDQLCSLLFDDPQTAAAAP